jgi:hypothetical protein
MINRKTIETFAVLALCAASSIACGGSSQSAAETAPAKAMDSQQGGETPDGTSTADDAQQDPTRTMPDGTTMQGEDMGQQ